MPALDLGEFGVIVGRDADVLLAVDVEEDRLDRRGPAHEEQVLGIGVARAWAQPDPAATRHRNAVDDDRVTLG